MDHLDLAGVLTTPSQWHLPVFEQQDATYLSSSRQMLEPIMEETSEDEECALNSWQQYEQQSSDAEGGTTEGESVCGGTGGNGSASFWSSAESDTGSVIRIEVTKDNDSTSERDFLCPAKRPRRCEDSLAQSLAEEEVILRRPLLADIKNTSLERFLNYESFSRDSWGANSQQRSSVGSRRGFDDFYSDCDSLSYNSLSRSSSLIQFESLERQLLIQEQHASMSSLGNSSPSLLSFDLQTSEEIPSKNNSNSGNNSANNSRRGSQSSLLKKYESLDGRLHQTYYDLDKLNFDDMGASNNENFSRGTTLKISSHMAELRSDSESSSESSEGSSRPRSVLSPDDINDSEFHLKKFNHTNSQQNKKSKSSAENLSEDSGYCEPSMGFGLRRSKSQTLLKNYEKFSEEEEEMENKSLIHANKQTFKELNAEEPQQMQTANNKHSNINEFKNTNTRDETIMKSPPLSPQLEFIRHKQRSETHSPSPVSSEVSTSSSTSSQSTNSNDSRTSSSSTSSSSASSSSSSASSTSSATTCASKASFTWLMPSTSAARSSPLSSSKVYEEEENQPSSQISINDLREVKTTNGENVENFGGILKSNIENFLPQSSPQKDQFIDHKEQENEYIECRNTNELNERGCLCHKCGENIEINRISCEKYLSCQTCKEKNCFKDQCTNSEIPKEIGENNLNCKNCGEILIENLTLQLSEKVRKKIIEQQLQLLTDKCGEFENNKVNEYDSVDSSRDCLKFVKSYENSPKTTKNLKKLEKNSSLDYSSCISTPDTSRRLLGTVIESYNSSDSDYSPLRIHKNFYTLMPNWPVKTSSVPNELNTIGRKKKLKKSRESNSCLKPANSSFPNTDNESVNDFETSSEDLYIDCSNIKRSLSWSFQSSCVAETESFCVEAKNLGLLHQSYHNLAVLDLELEPDNLKFIPMAEKRISSDYETEIVCKNNFLLDELSAHYDRTASILNDKPVNQADGELKRPQLPPRSHARKTSNSSYSAGKEYEEEGGGEVVHHVQLVIRKPPARQKRDKEEKSNSLTQDYSFANIMQCGSSSVSDSIGTKTFDQDPTILKTSYAQSLEKCNFDCKELSIQDLNKTRNIPKRRFHSQANKSKKKSLVSSTPNLNAFDFNHQDDIEDDIFVSSAHTSMHQLPLSQTQKPLGILLPVGSRTSFGKEVSFCPVVSKYCWQEQSSEECNDASEEVVAGDEESEDELLDNADATVIYNTKENENIASKYNEELLKKEQEQGEEESEKCENKEFGEVIEEKTVLKEMDVNRMVENVVLPAEEHEERELKLREDGMNESATEERDETLKNSDDVKEQIRDETEERVVMGTSAQSSGELLPAAVTKFSLTTISDNKLFSVETDSVNVKENKSVNDTSTTTVNTKNSLQTNPTVVVARPLSIQLPILSKPPINRAHHILYASQQMLDNFQRQKEDEEYEQSKSQSTQNLSRKKMSSEKPVTGDLQQQATNSKLNNNNEIMKSKFKHEEKHPNSKGFLSRFANGFRFSLRRNKKKLQQKENKVTEDIAQTNGVSNEAKSRSLPVNIKQADFIHIPLKGPLPENRNGNFNEPQSNGNSVNVNAKNTTVSKQKGAKTKDMTTTRDKQKVTGKPPIPPQQQQQLQQMQKLQSAQSSHHQQQQQPLVEVGLSRFYTETNNTNTASPNPCSIATQDFLITERLYNDKQNQQQLNVNQSCTNNQSSINKNGENIHNNNSENSSVIMTTINTNNTATYDFSSPSRASVSQKTQMFNNLSRKSEQPKIGLIETNLDTHETIITGKTRSLINIGSNQQQRYAGNKRVHANNINSYRQHQQGHHDGNEADDDEYGDNDDDEVIVRPDGTIVVIKNAGTNVSSSSASQAAQIATVRRPHKSMEFLLDKENQKDVMVS